MCRVSHKNFENLAFGGFRMKLIYTYSGGGECKKRNYRPFITSTIDNKHQNNIHKSIEAMSNFPATNRMKLIYTYSGGGECKKRNYRPFITSTIDNKHQNNIHINVGNHTPLDSVEIFTKMGEYHGSGTTAAVQGSLSECKIMRVEGLNDDLTSAYGRE
uniref:Uncharacterized protein n=1 Tax=Glossina austeni TaxID=7395 RepID=A0A1A9VGN4_GLOAU